MNSYIKALKFFLVPTALAYIVLAFITLSLTKPFHWFTGMDTASLLLRAILLVVELICYFTLVSYYEFRRKAPYESDKNITFNDWFFNKD